MNIKKEFHDRLLQGLYSEYNVSTTNIDSTVSYYNSNPGEWVDIYNRVRKKIQEIRKKYKTESSLKIDSLLSKPRQTRPLNSYKKGKITDDKINKSIEPRKKSEENKKTKSAGNKEKPD
jgi:hypothetical protein